MPPVPPASARLSSGMTAAPERSFQFHLLTAVVVMLTAGALLLLNFQIYERPVIGKSGEVLSRDLHARGWPAEIAKEKYINNAPDSPLPTCWEWRENAIIFNVVIALVFLYLTIVGVEILTHREPFPQPRKDSA